MAVPLYSAEGILETAVKAWMRPPMTAVTTVSHILAYLLKWHAPASIMMCALIGVINIFKLCLVPTILFSADFEGEC